MQCFPTARVEQTLALGQMIGRPSVAEIANSGAEQRRPAADMEERFGERGWGRYSFCDAFNPTEDWTDDDFIACGGPHRLDKKSAVLRWSGGLIRRRP